MVDGSAYARLLYGAISPATELQDVALLTRLIVDNYVPDAAPWLAWLDLPLDLGDVSQLMPGEQGARLGEQACELLCGKGGSWVDIHSVVQSLDIQVSEIGL